MVASLLLLATAASSLTRWEKYQRSLKQYNRQRQHSLPEERYLWKMDSQNCAADLAVYCESGKPSECEKLCRSTENCSGFDSRGVLKGKECARTATRADTTLYLLKDEPQYNAAEAFPPIWPLPASFSNGTVAVDIDPLNWNFTATVASSDLTNAFRRFRAHYFPHRTAAPQPSSLLGVKVTVRDVSSPLQLETSESYTLDVPTSGFATITADSVYGAYHGLETLSQLVRFDFTRRIYVLNNAPWHIEDAPRFKHREVLLDTARHFHSVTSIKALIDSLTYAKVNVVHWHLVDSESFPFDSPSNPKLVAGAFSEDERYSIEDVADVVEYARQRGVRIMPEIDVPGHAAAWCVGYPEICPSVTCKEPLNPATNRTFDLIAALLKDLTGGSRGGGVAFENLFHLGGDEVIQTCWNVVPSISNWLKEKNFTSDQAYEYFVKRVQETARSQGRDVVGWEEIWDHFHTSLDKSTIIHQWLYGSTIAKDAIKNGYRVLWSTSSVWYLDHLDVKWQTMYAAEPCDGIPDDECSKFMLGGGGEMWGETVDTSDILQTVWPRLGAIAERLWSPRAQTTDPKAAASRFAAFRCLLNRRGVAASPSANSAARAAPPNPGACLAQ